MGQGCIRKHPRSEPALLEPVKVQPPPRSKSPTSSGRSQGLFSSAPTPTVSSSTQRSSAQVVEGPHRIVMKKYAMHMTDDDIMGEGNSSICRRGTNLLTNETVAIKVYKVSRSRSKNGQAETLRTKFTRQIEVLRELMAPLEKSKDESLWCEQLELAPSDKLFMQLLDYSGNLASSGFRGTPGPDPDDGEMYVVTEMASCSLKEYIAARRKAGKAMSKETVRAITKAMMLVTAGLHAKGFVHLDLKPENLMLFNGVLKLIDVDGCIRIGTKISITDSSLSFSPCYCSPEWARFIHDDSPDPYIIAAPGLDVWSIGMTIPELITHDAILRPVFVSFLKHGRPHRQASIMLMEWLSSVKKVPIPKSVESFDKDLLSLLVNSLLVPDPAKRKTLAESLNHPFVKPIQLARSVARSSTSPITYAVGDTDDDPSASGGLRRRERKGTQDITARHKGVLWKCSKTQDPSKKENWYKRDVWLSANGSLCYHSPKQGKQLILIDGHQMANADLGLFEKGAIEPAIEISIAEEDEDEDGKSLPRETHVFGCESEEDYAAWMDAFESARHIAALTMKLGRSIAVQLKEFRLTVNNRRIKVDDDDSADRVPVFKSKLWKLKADSDWSDKQNWREREMWISQNGSLVYYSVLEDRELVYYSASDLARATVSAHDQTDSCMSWGFSVQLPAQDGVEFAPGEFAADSEDLRTEWMKAVRRPALIS
ncbi:unnamed protein product [Prorocentrum cordatum]|uniref:Aurora kinase n=1 Tax=Prorocentrum cordatum TaxID=2364126 RepID=A0ABN9W3Z2_9DINO|nr:unnamed protein product [Polarella glacialis]|mmetsp:Transcript_60142/g.170833  ORF Transcript_60142/g.170833 Transcript_60142/m.170833 type:complete len:711 (+) Transcript_60142:58-2190(+)